MNHIKLIIITCFLAITTMVSAQSIEITPSVGYQFGTRLDYGANYIEIDQSDQYSITIAYELGSNLMGEFTYMRHSSELNIRDVIISPIESRLADLNADWFLIGASKYFRQDNIRPFVGAGGGIVVLSPGNENYELINRPLDNDTRFTFAFKAGINAMLTKVIGLNMQFNVLLPIDWGGVYVGGGTGGVSAGVSASGSTILAGFSAGLVFKFDPN